MANKPLKSITFPDLPDTYVVPEQVQADWNQTDSTAKDFIKNKPTTTSTPFFDLSAMGLPAVPIGGDYVELTGEDLTALRTSLSQGPVKLGFAINAGAELAATAIANIMFIAAEDTYQCVITGYYNGTTVIARINIMPDTVLAKAETADQGAYESAQAGGYTGTRTEFNADLAAMDGMAAWFAAL